MERIVKTSLKEHLSRNKVISPAQHGFLAKRSTETQRLECVNDSTKGLDRQKCIDVLYLDVVKAFDVVSHQKLIFIFVE